MSNIRVDLCVPVYDGKPVTFKSPADCSSVTGLIVYYPEGDTTISKTFQFADAHGNNVGGKDLFAEEVLVKVLLDTEKRRAYVQNADTNAYLEGRFEQCEDLIYEQVAKKEQLKPEFVNSIAECTDTTKMYVLPDGYIYAYMPSYGEELIPNFTNKLPLLTDENGDPCNNGKGYKTDTRLSTYAEEKVQAGIETTGYIPCKLGDVIYLENIICKNTSAPADPNAPYTYFAVYDKDKAFIDCANVGYFDDGNGAVVLKDKVDTIGTVIQINTANLKYAYSSYDIDLRHENMAFFRFSCEEINSSSIITVNEPIEYRREVTGYKWQSTGHAFVPADYEDRIIEVEKSVATLEVEVPDQRRALNVLARESDDHETRIGILDGAKANHEDRISTLESGTVYGLPDYAVKEAERVIDRVVAAQDSRTFTFAAITDMHYGNNSNKEGVEHACHAMKYIDQRIKLDAVAVLGDFTDGYPADNLDNALGDFEAVNRVLDELRFAPNLRVQGNHDYYANNFPITNRFIQSYSDDVVWGDKLGGYFYKDFADHKLRVICVNTVETGNDLVRCSTAQYEWFVSSLDLSGKADAKDWQILVLSHHPLDWYVESDYVFCYVLDAYKKGTSGTAGGVSFDFTGGKNIAKLIGNIHGHIHNLLTDNLYFGNVNSGNQTTVLRMCTPEACVGRENQYEGAWADSESYPKTTGTANETSFCVYCIDLDAGVIKAICYGAGYDREVSYQYANDVEPPKIPTMTTEMWEFELEDGTTVTKQVVVMK